MASARVAEVAHAGEGRATTAGGANQDADRGGVTTHRTGILWQDTGGAHPIIIWNLANNVYFQLKNSACIGGCTGNLILANAQVLGVGDLNGDGTDDLVFTYPGSPTVKGALITNGAVTSIVTIGTSVNGERLEEVGDFDHSGKADLLWRSRINGAVKVWVANVGLTWTAHTILPSYDLQWEIINQ